MPPTYGNPERLKWSMSRSEEGHREYKLSMLVKMTDPADGPWSVLNSAGLPAIGASWTYGNDNDPWAFCTPNVSAKMVIEDEPNILWMTEHTFSTRPLRRCQDNSIDNPLAEPPDISGSYLRYVKKLEKDRNSKAILSSSHEQITGLERDASRLTIVIGRNMLNLDLPTLHTMVDTLNDSAVWGLDSRKIKLGAPRFERRLYGTCSFYINLTTEFEIRPEGWDIDDVADTGYKKFHVGVLADTPENRANPKNYILAKDYIGGNPPQRILLDGNGDPLTDPTNPHYLDPIEGYGESNFYLLDIPSSLV